MGDIMQEYNELFNKFDKLGLDAKRNAYSEEILKLSFLLKLTLAFCVVKLIKIPFLYSIFPKYNFSSFGKLYLHSIDLDRVE